MNPHTFHQWITRKYGFFTQHRRKYPTLVHLRFPQRKISLARYLLIKHEHITIFPRLRTRVYSFNHRFYLKFNLFFPQYHYHPAIQILPFQARVNTRFTPTKERKYPSDVGARPDFMFARTAGKIRVESEKELYHYRDSHHSYHRQVQTGHEHEIVQLFHRFYRLQSTAFPGSLPGPFTGEGYYPSPVMIDTGDLGKSEIRISKFETNSNDKNSNDQNEKNLNTFYQNVFVSNLEHYSRATAIIPGKSPAGMVKFPTYFFEPRRYTKGHEEEKNRRNEETEKRRLEGEGFPERLELASIYRSMIMSKNISHVVDPGKEAFYMARMRLLRPVTLCATLWGQSMIMSKNISYVVDPGKEVFQTARMDLFRAVAPGGGPGMQLLPFSGRTRGSPLRSPGAWYSGNKTGEGRGEPCVRPYPESQWFLLFPDSFPGAAPWGSYRRRQEGSQLAVGNWQLARKRQLAVGSRQSAKREEAGKRRNEETEKRRREVEGFPERLEPGSLYRLMIMSKNISHVVDSGKEAFYMARMRLLRPPTQWGLFFFIKNRYDSNVAAVTIEKSLARMFKFPTYFFEPRRHLQCGKKREGTRRREEEKKRRNEETEKRRLEGEGFHRHEAAIQILPFQARVNTRFTPTNARKRPAGVGARPDFVFARTIGKIRISGNEGSQLARREETRKPRNEETEKRRLEGEGFLGHLEPGSIFRSMIMSKKISHVVDTGKEAFQMARMRLLWLPTPWGPERLERDSLYQLMIMSKNISHVVDPGKEVFHRHERNQLAVGSWQLARREEFRRSESQRADGQRRKEEVKMQGREAEGFPERLEPDSIYRFMIMSKNISHVVVPGKEAFHMARMRLFEKFSGGPGGGFTKEPPGRRRHMESGSPKKNRFTPSLDYFTPHRVSVGDRDQSLMEAGKPGFPAMDVKDKITSENIFGNHASPGISQQQGPNIDIDQLTDRVYRVLEEKIRTEKEMRGW